MDSKYKIVFRGDIVPGHGMPDVRARLQDMFRLDDDSVARLFSGRPTVIKRDLDEANARKWCDLLAKAGALVDSVADEVVAPAAEPPPPADGNPSSDYDMGVLPPGADVLTPAERQPPVARDVPTDHLSLDDVGADVLREDERAPPVELELDLSHLHLADDPQSS